MSKVEIYYCDIKKCNKSLDKWKKEHEPIKMQVIFVTETTEGYPSNPYFQYQELMLCPECKARALEGNYIFAAGAQGYNDYYFKKGQNDE